jgi:hypothetical protein
MHTTTGSTALIQTTSASIPSTPSWFGEAVIRAPSLRHSGMLATMAARVHVSRRRFGHDEVIDVLAVLCGSAVSGERTLEEFDTHVRPCAQPFLALFGRDRLPGRSTRSRFFAALTGEPVEALRPLFLEDLFRQHPDVEQQPCGRTDRAGTLWKVFDSDGTREAARQRAFPTSPSVPRAHRRVDEIGAPGDTGRTRGDIVRSRTTV